MLPYSVDVYFALIGRYYTTFWWVAVAAVFTLALAAVVAWRRPRGHGRLVGGLLVFWWAWVGVMFFAIEFARLNFAAPLYALLFGLQALLLLWSGVLRDRLAGPMSGDFPGFVEWSGLGLVVAGGLLYPLADGWVRGSWPEMRWPGMTPTSTTVVTLGLFLMLGGRAARYLAIVPLLWAMVLGYTAWTLGMPREGLALGLIVGGSGLFLIRARRSPGA